MSEGRPNVTLSTPLWQPSPERAGATRLEAFRRHAERVTGASLPDYDALHAWSVNEPDRFWLELAAYLQVPFIRTAAHARSPDPMPDTRWFEGATLNYAAALLYPKGLGDPDQVAIIAVTEAGAEERWSYAELRRLVARIQVSLERAGVGEGDAVAAFAANVPQTVALLLACAGLGVTFTSCSPDFGHEAAAARFGQVRPKLLFASTSYRYAGRTHSTRAAVSDLAQDLPSVEEVVLLPYPGKAPDPNDTSVGRYWDAWLAVATEAPSEPTLEALPFDHPLYVLFSSGTTGLPKAIVHRQGGALLTHAKEHALHSDIRSGDVVFYYTTCGWMMWNWLVSALAQAATIVLYDGAPAAPDLMATFRLAERLGTTFFGTSARFLHELQVHGVRPGDEADLGALRTIASTGSPLSPGAFRYVYDAISTDVHLASISGGTDIVACFMLGVPTLPVYAGQIQRPGLGVDLAVFDDDGQEVRGVPGELVCRQPLPSMPLAFLNDPDGSRYRAAYFDVYPGVWRHGDLVERTAEGGIVVYGRSDATLNPSGVRIGTAEIYRPLEHVRAVTEAAAVGKKVDGDEEIWLLVVLRQGTVLDEALEREIRRVIREGASPRHVPRRVVQVRQLPRTRSGKAMEMAVARIVNGREVTNRAVMANPESIDEIRAVIERESQGSG